MRLRDERKAGRTWTVSVISLSFYSPCGASWKHMVGVNVISFLFSYGDYFFPTLILMRIPLFAS